MKIHSSEHVLLSSDQDRHCDFIEYWYEYGFPWLYNPEILLGAYLWAHILDYAFRRTI